MIELGFNDGWTYRYRDDTPADYGHLGATWARVPWVWTYEKAKAYEVVDRMHDAGIKTVLCPYSFTNDLGNDAYVEQLLETAVRYPGSPLEPWNEVNWRTYGNWPVEDFAAAFRRCHDAIRLVYPARVILACSGYMMPCGKEDWQRKFAELTHDLRYAASVHIYIGGCPQFVDRPDLIASRVLDRVQATFPGRPVWATEVGWSSGNTDEEKQRQMLGTMVRTLEDRGLRFVFVHRLYDGPPAEAANPTDAGWGVKRFDGTWKPVADELVR